MKSPGKFGKEKDLSPEEQIIEMDRKYAVIIERIQTYDSMMTEFSNLKSSLSMLWQDYEDACKAITSLTKYSLNSYEEYTSKQGALKAEMGNVYAKMDSLDNKFTDKMLENTRSFDSVKDQIAKVDQKHTDKFSRCLSSDDLQAVKKPFSDSLNIYASALNGLSEKVKSLTDGQVNLIENHVSLHAVQSDFAQQLQESNVTLTNLSKKSDAAIASLKSYVDNLSDKTKDQVVNYMDNTKVEMIGSPSSIATVRAEIMNKLNLTSLDGSNAVLKVSNLEQQLKLIERKLENLSILQKKNEISKMV